MPTFFGNSDFQHDHAEKIGVLLVNLGTPDAPTPSALRRYLRVFLGDRRVVEMARPIWWLILNGIILNTRPRKSAAMYERVWTDEGSPLLLHARRQAQALSESLSTRAPGRFVVELAMNYGSPGIREGLDALNTAGARRLLVLPLYPQYSATTTASVFDRVTGELQNWRWWPELRFINSYHDAPGYLDALADSIREQWAAFGQPEKLLFSYHGIPADYFHKGDPYHCHCHATTRGVVERLGLERDRWDIAFQSRVGPKEWLKPYTDKTLEKWGKQGVKSVHVVCPGFSADCLETIDEIGHENRELFVESGGGDYRYLPALNDRADHIAALADLVESHSQGWGLPDAAQLERRKQRALDLGAER